MNNVEFFYDAIICGTFGTALMSGVDWCLSNVFNQKQYVVKILGIMLVHANQVNRQSKFRVLVTGTAAHFLTGIFFAGIYIVMWKSGKGQPVFTTGLWWGFLNGLMGILIWRLYFLMHPDPPVVNLPVYLTGILAAHIFFGAGITGCYQLLHWY